MMRHDAEEAAALVDRMLANLAATVPAKGRAGSDARTAIGDTRAQRFQAVHRRCLGPAADPLLHDGAPRRRNAWRSSRWCARRSCRK